jgi:hypothetical protein
VSIVFILGIVAGFVYDPIPKKLPVPTADSGVDAQKPVFDENNNTFNFIINGKYSKISDKVSIKVYIREIKADKDGKISQTKLFDPVALYAVDMSPDKQSYSIIREADEPRSGSFLGLIMCPKDQYRPNTHRYEFKVEFYEGKKLIGVHRQKDNEWILVPTK